MKKIKNNILALGLSVVAAGTLTGCIDETVPTNMAQEEQIGQSSAGAQALVLAMPAFFNNLNEDFYEPTRYDFNFGYGAMIRMRATLTEPFVTSGSGYDWFSPWADDLRISQDESRPNYVWTYYYQLIQTANNVLSSVPDDGATDSQLGFRAAASAVRAMAYLDMGQMYEFLPNDKTSNINADGNDVTGLTVPIVKDGMTEAESRNNPRVKKDSLVAFIESDLAYAEQHIGNLTLTTKTLPHLDVVYGLQARLYMWAGDYAKAQTAARNAIDASSVSPMTEADCTDTSTGFNDLSKFMWGSQQTAEDDAVSTGIINWISWMCNEQSFGYTGSATGDYIKIDTLAYNRLSDTDFRKKEWVAPAGSALEGQNKFVSASYGAKMPALASLKFRPGSGNMSDVTVGAVTAIPMMRVEEMYFIEAEAAAHQNASEGKALLESFMQQYRDPQYSCTATTTDGVVEEIYFQKSIELWGEGITFFDMKRLNYSLTRGYTGTNHSAAARLNTNGRPAHLNFVIYRTEAENNTALKGWNNPDPTSVYTPWTE